MFTVSVDTEFFNHQGESLLLGDLMILLKAVGVCEYSERPEEFCQRHGLRLRAVREVRKLRQQLTSAGDVMFYTRMYVCT